MNQNNKIEDLAAMNATKIGIWIEPKFKKFEKLSVLISVIGLILLYVTSNMDIIVLTIGLTLLSLLYFFRSFTPIDMDRSPEPGIDNFAKYIAYWGLSIVIVGILFRLSNFPGHEIQLRLGCILLFGMDVFSIYWINKHIIMKDVYLPIIYRSTLFLVIGLALHLTPDEKLEEFKLIKNQDPIEVIE